MRNSYKRVVLSALVGGVGVCLLAGVTAAATFHVSPLGSNTPPYDTYAKAANNPRDAIALADSGDIVRIGAGTYRVDSTILLKRSFVSIQGAGLDSTVIEFDPTIRFGFCASGYEWSPDFGWQINDIAVHGSEIPLWLMGRYQYPFTRVTSIRRCEFRGGEISIQPTDCQVTIDSCRFVRYGEAVLSIGAGPINVINSVFQSDDVSIALDLRGSVGGVISHNTAICGYSSTFLEVGGTGVTVTNNYIDVGETAIQAVGGGIRIRNNLIAGGIRPEDNPYNLPYREVMTIAPAEFQRITCESNLIIAHRPGYVRIVGPMWSTADVTFSYNAMWGFRPDSLAAIQILGDTPQEPRTVHVDTTGLIWSEPMLAPDSSGHLQKQSPLIDAGDPLILDTDSTRSDIGVFGGPEGSRYEYLDYPPGVPGSLTGDTVARAFLLAWRPDTETDLTGYRVYRDSIMGFIPNFTNQVASVGLRTSYLETRRPAWQPWYFKVTAVDSAGQESRPSNEVHWRPDSVSSAIPRVPTITRTFPNPFNSTLVIEYLIPDAGALPAEISVRVYNSLGGLVRTIHDGSQQAGVHQTVWDGRDNSGAAAASGVYFVRLSYWNRQTSQRKIVLVK